MLPKSLDPNKKSSSSTSKPPAPRNYLQLTRESPPSVFFGPPEVSSGVLLSGTLYVHVIDPSITLQGFTLRLVARATQKKPIVKDCPECIHQESEIKSWNFLTEPKTLNTGPHNYPFSHLIPGRLPATSDGKFAQISYHLLSIATTSTGEKLSLAEELKIVRSLAVPNEKISIRVFPPTKMEAHVGMVPVIHPIGRFAVTFSLRKIENPPLAKHPKMHTRWALRKLIWKLEETEASIAPACSKHTNKVGGENRGKEYKEDRTLAKGELTRGWKRDCSDPGSFDTEFEIALGPQGSPGAQKALCDLSTPSGSSITHMLVIELIVAEEWMEEHKPSKWSPSGQARVLRCQFGVKVTERAGLGISWDEENPPLYEDMTQGPPPDYSREFGLPPLREEHLTEMSQRAQREAARIRGEEVPDSPPMYGSIMNNVPLEEVFDGLELEEARRFSEERRFGQEDLQASEDDSREREGGAENSQPLEEEDASEGPSDSAWGNVQ